jgi:hypothetical protein
MFKVGTLNFDIEPVRQAQARFEARPGAAAGSGHNINDWILIDDLEEV